MFIRYILVFKHRSERARRRVNAIKMSVFGIEEVGVLIQHLFRLKIR